nr:hypothetical protein [Tanacetum cinerariifolium]
MAASTPKLTVLRYKGLITIITQHTTLEHEDEGHTDSMAEPNLRTIRAPQRSRLDDGHVCREMVDEFAPLKFFASVRGMEHDQLFIEFNVRAACQMSLSAEVRMRAEYNVKERSRLKSVVGEKDELLKAREEEIRSLKARLLLKEAEATEAIRLYAEASNFEAVRKVPSVHELETSASGLQEKVAVYENCMEQLEKFQDDRMKIVGDKFDKLYNDFVEMALHLEEQFYPHLLTTTLAAGGSLPMAWNFSLLSACTNLNIFLPSKPLLVRPLRKDVNFPLFAELRSNKDASVETIMEVFRLEDPVAEKLRLSELEPNVNQLMVPIHSSPDRVVIGATALSIALDASSSRVQNIRENIANHKSVLHDAFVSLAEPISIAALTGMEGTFDCVPATVITTALSTTLALTSTVNPISKDDYEFVDTDDQAVVGGDAASFPNVDDTELLACSLLSSKRSRLISRASLFCIRSTFAVLSVGMPIFAGMTASVSYVSENRVSSLLDFIIVRLRFALSTKPLSMATIKNLTFPVPSGKGPAMSIPHL